MSLASLALVLASCGGESRTKPEERGLEQQPFPFLRVDVSEGIDSLDPGVAYSNESWQSLWNVYLAPYTYAHANGRAGARIVPALAEDMPEISASGLTYRFRLRGELRYSNGKPVTAGDFGYAIRRLYLLDSLGAPLFDNVVGATVTAARRGPIPGIETDDVSGTVTIRLSRPDARLLDALASPFAAPVPQSTPRLDRTRKPIPSTGPYRIGQVHWPKEFTLERNRYFEPTEYLLETNPERIAFSIVKDSRTAFERLVAGQSDYSSLPIELGSLEAAQDEGTAQLRMGGGSNTYYFFMNTQVRPFDDVRVRRAVNFALDRKKLAAPFGDLAVPSENILPPIYPSAREHELYPYDLGKAKILVRKARKVGSRVTIYAPAGNQQAREAVAYLRDQLTAIGLRPQSTRLLPSALYWPKIGDPDERVQIGYAYWIQRSPHPLAWFEPLLGVGNANGLGQANYSFAQIGAVMDAISDLGREPVLTDEVNARWAELEKEAMASAPIAPFVHLRTAEALSPRIDTRCSLSSVVYGLDLGRVCMRRETSR